MKSYYLAIDIGASSGRHMLGSMEHGKMQLEEIYRFTNQLEAKNNQLCWDMDKLFFEIKQGLKKCKDIGKVPVSIGIDTWAVDFVLLDEKDKPIGECVGYRDARTSGMDEKVYAVIKEEELYERTGIQKQIFNTIYQLMAVKEQTNDLEKAKSLLMVPDYLHYLLTGQKRQEYTNATTTQLVSPITKEWDLDLIEKLGFKKELFTSLSMPGTLVGELSMQMQEEIGFNTKVILPATHDTASAVLSVPTTEKAIYISSGTWSLMGVEQEEADCSSLSKAANFTNEGGYDFRFRYLKNIMGLWMIQCIKKEWQEPISFEEISKEASKQTIDSIVDCNDARFLAPQSMIQEVQNYCKETHQKIPVTIGEIASVIYNSLGVCYAKVAKEIEERTKQTYSKIHVVGGGANARYLNELTARYTKKEVHAGPIEATAIGNLVVQMIEDGIFESIEQARACIYQSFEITIYKED